MELDKENMNMIEKQINMFLNSGNNDYYEFSRNELRDIFIDNPKQVIIINPDGQVTTYDLQPNEHHYVGFMKYLKVLQKDNIPSPKMEKYLAIDYYGENRKINVFSKDIRNFLIDINCIIIYSLISEPDLHKHYGILLPEKMCDKQNQAYNDLLEDYNLNEEFLNNYSKKNSLTYDIPFENIKKNNNKR